MVRIKYKRIRRFTIPVEDHILVKLKHKCNFYDIAPRDLFAFMAMKFIDGDFDEELQIKKLAED